MNQLDWMADQIAGAPDALHAVIFTADGMVRGRSADLPEDMAETLAAGGGGLISLGSHIGELFGGEGACDYVMVRHGGGFLFLRAAANHTRLALVTTATVDPTLIGAAMQDMVKRLGEQTLSTPARPTSLP